MHLEGKLSHQRLQPGIITLKLLDLSSGSVPGEVSGKPLFASFQEVFKPGIIGARLDAFPAAEVTDGSVPSKTFQHDANLLFGGELAARDTLDIPDKLLCLLSPGFGLLDIVYSLFQFPAPFQSLLYFFLGAGATLKCPLV